jgi:hypothetical protein
MNSTLLLRNLLKKNFGKKAKIHFVGKRSILPGENFNKPTTVKEAKTQPESTTPINIRRVQLSKEEIEIVNNGGDLNIKDWRNIKYVKKSKI